MTAPKGTRPFSSKRSKKSEKKNVRIIKEVLKESGFEDFTWTSSYSVNKIYDSHIAKGKRGKDSMTKPDFGLIFYKETPVILGDNKWQKETPNACERAAFYAMDALQMKIPLKNVFVVFDGPGFEEINESGHIPSATGKMVVRAKKWFTALIRPTEEQITTEFRKLLSRVKLEQERLRRGFRCV